MNAAHRDVEIQPVQTRAQQRAFLKFPFQHYQGDPNWVPPLLMNEKELLNFKPHPFYDNGEIQPFLAYRNGNIVGRIAAIVDGAHNAFHKEQRGMFGFFESIDDTEVAHALFDTARNWFAERDIFLMRGPANPSQNYTWGLLVDGFDTPPKFMMTYNKPYYEQLILSYGFFKSQDLFAFGGEIEMLDNLDPKLAFVVEEAKRRFQVKVRMLNRKKFSEDVDTFMSIYNSALPGQWGFTPLSESEVREIAKGLKYLIIPELTTFAEIDGRPVGTVFALLDYNPLIKQIGGKLFPFGFLKLLFGRKQLDAVRLISTNVVPEYQRWGLGLVLLEHLVPAAREWGIKRGEFSWVLESNKLSRGTLERGGSKLEKTYRIYDYEVS